MKKKIHNGELCRNCVSARKMFIFTPNFPPCDFVYVNILPRNTIRNPRTCDFVTRALVIGGANKLYDFD